MRLTALTGAFLSAVVLLAAVNWNASWRCTASLSVKPSQFQQTTSGSFLGYNQIGVSPHSRPGPKTFFAELRGEHDFAFVYSKNIEQVKLKLGPETLYEGPPINSYDATHKGLHESVAVTIDGPGTEFFLEIVDRCSVGSTIRSLF